MIDSVIHSVIDPAATIDDCTGLVLAGGESRRMGRDKTVLEFGGRSLLQSAVDRLRDVFPQVWVSVRQRRAEVTVPQVLDEVPDAGPLAGVCAGLAQTGDAWVFAMAADMPFLDGGTIRALATWRDARYAAVVPIVDGVPQPLAAYYAAAALPALRAALAGPGKSGLRAVLERLDVAWVNEDRLRRVDSAQHAFADVDTPDDLARCRQWTGGDKA